MRRLMRSREPKILFFLPSYYEEAMGGAELQTKYIAERAIAKNYDVSYLFLTTGVRHTNSLGISLVSLPKKNFFVKFGNIFYPYSFALLNKLEELKPDVIYNRAGSAFTGIAAYFAKKKESCRFIFHIASDKDVSLSPYCFSKPFLYPEKKMIEYGIKNNDAIIAQTYYQDRLLQKNYHCNANMVVPNGHPVPEVSKKSSPPINILWIANWKPIKQPEIFVDLACEFSNVGGVHLTMIGMTGNRYQKLVNKAKKYGVEVLGSISNDRVNELLSQSHILINTSLQEGFSNTFIQAWMRNVPVLSLTVDPDGVLEKHRIGYCAGNFKNLVECAKRLISDGKLREEMGYRGRAYAIANYSMSNIDDILDLMIAGCISKRS